MKPILTLTSVSLLLLGLAACGKGGDLPPGATEEDRDGDGLSNREEAEWGSDPDTADTDRDGYDDGLEVDSYTDPINGFDHPYAGGWPIDACRHDLGDGSGFVPGSVVEGWSLMDQNGDGVRIHDFCGRVVVVASAAEWCQPCLDEAAFLSDMQDEYRSQGLVVVTLLGQNTDGITATRDELGQWATTFGANHPVLQDVGFSISTQFAGTTSMSLPSTHMIDRGGVIHSVALEEITEQMITDLLGG